MSFERVEGAFVIPGVTRDNGVVTANLHLRISKVLPVPSSNIDRLIQKQGDHIVNIHSSTSQEDEEPKALPSNPLVPKSTAEAIENVTPWAGADRQECRTSNKQELLTGWFALQYLFPGLNPDDAIDSSEQVEPWPEAKTLFPHLAPAMHYRSFESEWPIALVELLREMWRRYETGEIEDADLYCHEAQRLGLMESSTNTE